MLSAGASGSKQKHAGSLPAQGELLRRLPWNVLLILDACRADYFRRLVPGASTVRSLYSITWGWVARFAGLAGELDHPVLYVTANPVVDREMKKYPDAPIRMLSVWRDRWGRHGPLGLPTVHPRDVVAAVREYVEVHGQPARMVVHFIQPHVPFIGRRSVPYSGWGRGMGDELSRQVKKLPHVRDALADGLVTIEKVRDCYRDNLELVLRFRNELSAQLRGLVLTTADHGELLGERGLYGHTAGPRHPELMKVPWLEERRGLLRPAPLPPTGEMTPEGEFRGDAEEEMKRKLEALGYA